MASSPLFSRIITIVGVFAVLGAAYWFITTSLTPVPVPPVPPQRASVRFDPRVDVSKDAVFTNLHPLSALSVNVGEMGRVNPFVPAPPAAIASELLTASSTTNSDSAAKTASSTPEVFTSTTTETGVNATSTGPNDLIPPKP